MKEHVWLIADQGGDVSYFEHGAEGDEENWRTIGPFAFTTRVQAEEYADNPRFLPEGVQAELFTVLEVEASAFVQAIFNGFPPSNTDVFTLDDGIFPLTNAGAEWVDEALGSPIWEPLFNSEGDGSGLEWIDRVLEQVASRLDMNMETVQAIGDINAAADDDVAAEVEQTQLLVQKHVRIAITPEPGTIAMEESEAFHILSPAARFWLHTNGMSRFGLPELEFRKVPAQWVTAAGTELNGWACFALDQGLSDGDEQSGGGPIPLKLRFVESPDEFWKEDGRECLRIEVDRVLFSVGHQKHGPEGPKMVH